MKLINIKGDTYYIKGGTNTGVVKLDEDNVLIIDPGLGGLRPKKIMGLLKENNIKEKEPSLMAKSMSWLKMNFKIQMNEDDQTIASLLFEGCSMGIETLYKYLHQYENASSKIKEVTEKLIEIEKELSQNIQNYL